MHIGEKFYSDQDLKNFGFIKLFRKDLKKEDSRHYIVYIPEVMIALPPPSVLNINVYLLVVGAGNVKVESVAPDSKVIKE